MQSKTKLLAILVSSYAILAASLAHSATFGPYTPTSVVGTTPLALDGCATNDGVTVTFNVPDDFTITDLNVGVNIDHTWRGDLFMTLTSPTRTQTIKVIDGGDNSDNFNVLLDDESVNGFGGNHPSSPPATEFENIVGPNPDGSIVPFYGDNAQGTWTFFVCDDFFQDTGPFKNAVLFFEGDSLAVVKSLATINTDTAPLGLINEGDVIEYTIVATNATSVVQTNVTVSDALLTPNSNSCAMVAPAASCSLTGTYTVTAADRQAGVISNTASAVSDQVAATNSNMVLTAVDTQLTAVKSQSSFVDNDVNGYISTGDVLTYTITATNTGANANIQVADPILNPSAKSCLNVNTAATCVLVGNYTVLAEDKLAGNILNTATASINGVNSIESNTVQVVVGPNPVADAESVFYMPLPEADALTAFSSIFPGPNVNTGSETCPNAPAPANPISTFSSITVLRSNTLIYYDHHEDGYEAVPNATAQATTQVWGDGDISNGVAPGNVCLVDSCDVLNAGIIIVLNNQIDTSGPDIIDFDGGDKISATDTISMTKANWSTGPNTLLAGAFELYPTTEWGTFYQIPVGQNIAGPTFMDAKFQYVGITVMAQQNGTTGMVDLDGNPGTLGDQTAFALNEGESVFIDGGILIGATVTASANVQVDIVTGDICASYEARFMTLFPSALWDNSYYNPIGTRAADNAPVRVILYNPDAVNPINVLVIDSFGSTPVAVPAGSFFDFLQNSDTAARYCTTADNVTCDINGAVFYAIASVDADVDTVSGANSTAEDWGLTLVPTSSLSQQALVGLGFGQDPLLPITENSSPVWVTADLISGTPTNGIQLCVDFDNDGTDSGPALTDPITGQEYDLRFTVNPYESVRLFDPDGNQTSLLVWVCESDALDASNAVIAAAWGQDPAVSTPGAPAIDFGTGIPNVSSIILLKEGELTNDINGDGFPSIGDTIQYKISLTNIGFVPVTPGAVLTDTLPTNVEYVQNSTLYFNSVTTTSIADTIVPPGLTEFPLDEAGQSLNDLLAVGNSFLITFDVIITSLPLTDVEICNNANVNVPFESVTSEFCIDIIPRNAAIGDFVWNDLDNDGIQDVGEAGIGGVTVTLVDIAGNPVLDGLSNPITTTTAANGLWSLSNLPIGDYRVLFDTSTSTDGLNYTLTSPNQGANDNVDSDGLSNSISGQSLTSIFTLAENDTNNSLDAGFILSTTIVSSQLCYVVNDSTNPNRLLSVDPVSGQTTDLGISVDKKTDTIIWDLGDPLVDGDETLYGARKKRLEKLLPAPSAIIGTFNSGVKDVDGYATDWQSVPPVFYASGTTGTGFLKIFDYNITNATVNNLSADIVLPSASSPIANSRIDGLAWDPINRRLIGITSTGTNDSHVVEFDLSAYPTVTTSDCGATVYDHDDNSGTAPIPLQGTEGATYSRPGELYISTGNAGDTATRNSLWKIDVDTIRPNCAIGPAVNLLAVRIGPANTFDIGGSRDSASLACGITFIDSNASIGNRVWLDEDGDGLQSAGEDGIGSVSVYLCRANASPCNASSAIRTDITDANGGYLFSGIPIMDYIVAVDTSTLPVNLATNPTYDEDNGTINPNNQTLVSLNRFEQEYLTADFGYNWNNFPETETPPAGALGAIGDRVWSDADGDGVQDSNEIGLNTVDLFLYDDPENDGVFDHFITSVTTDENGNYVFDGLPPGAYVVQLDPITLESGITWVQTGDPDDFAQLASNPDNMTTFPIILAPGDVYVNADFGYQGNAANTHSIGSTIYMDADADGVEDVGEPGIANVTISLLDSAGNTLAQTTTDNNGQYQFDGLPNGNYTVVVTDTNNVLAEKQQSGDPDATLDGKSNVTLAGADNLLQDFGYTAEGHTNVTGLIGDTVFLDLNGNGSQDSNEPGIESVKVELISNSTGFAIANTFTDENGNYSFGNLADGTYTVRIITTSLPNAGANLTNTADPDGGVANQSVVVIASGNINLLQDFGYQVTSNPNTIGGTLWNDSDADGTQEVGETQFFQGVTVNLLDANGNVVSSTTTDANGNYQFTGLPDGTYTLSVTDDGNVLAGHWLTDGSADGSDLNSQVVDYAVTVSGGANNQTADFGYYANLASIGNIVFRDDNNDGIRNPLTEPGIANVPVTLTITYPNTDSISITVFTDAFGVYSFDNLLADDNYSGDIANGPQPTYSISVVDLGSGFVSSYKGVADPAGIAMGIDDNADNHIGEAAFPVQGNSDMTNDFGFTPAAVIGDRVWLDLDNDGIQDANEDGIANMTVELDPPAGINLGNGDGVPITTITDIEGRYLFPNIPVAAAYVVTVLNPPAGLLQSYDEDGTASANTSTVNLTSGNQEYVTADFGYAPAAGTIGDYIWADANGDGQQNTFEIGIPGVTVELFNFTDNVTVTTTTTDATGHYLFTGVDVNKIYEVRVIAGIPASYVQTGDPDGVGAPDNQTTVPTLTTSNGFNLDADFGYQPPVANHFDIGDTVYIDLDNNSTQNGSEPGVPGVTVHLLIDTSADGNPDTAIASMQTNSNGNYLFPSLPAGENYGIAVTDTRNILNNYIQTDDPDVFFDGQSIILNLTANNLSQDFGYRPLGSSNGIIGDRIFHDVDGSGTQNAGDQGLEGVIVRLLNNGNLIDSVVTDENGQYLFTGLNTNETYVIEVLTTSLPNGGAGWNNNIDPFGANDSQATLDLSTVPTGIDLNQDFGYLAAVVNTIGGTVWRDDDGNGLLTSSNPDETGNGIQNVTVMLTDTNNNIVATTSTDANGNYAFAGLPNGSYIVVVTDDSNELANLLHTDGPNAGNNSIDNNSQDDTGYLVTVTAGQTNSTADFGYKPVITTPITLSSFNAVYHQSSGLTTITWSTLTETGNVGFELFALIEGQWHKVTATMVASKNMYKTTLTRYEYSYAGQYASEWSIVDVDIFGKRQTHGTFQTNRQYGSDFEDIDSKTPWLEINSKHKTQLNKRNAAKANALNQYIKAQKMKKTETKTDTKPDKQGEGS